MKKNIMILFVAATLFGYSCGQTETTDGSSSTGSADAAAGAGGQSAVQDNESAKDVVKIAAISKNHTTLVAAIKQADLVNALSNAGPFTVFAPTNEAFDKVDKNVLNDLMKDSNREKLQDILQYHVYVGSLKTEMMSDGQTLNQVNGANITLSVKDGKVLINNTASIIASIPASNGIIHVIDGVLLPPSK
jgi:uncharacterized surface protein with fasciclin (FAS1) repeats